MGYGQPIVRALTQEEQDRLKLPWNNNQLIDGGSAFRAERANVKEAIYKAFIELSKAQATFEHLEMLENINMGMIQHNNQSWRDLVAEFRSHELHGAALPAWSESAPVKKAIPGE